jgi:hypothetical protein
VLNSKEVGSKAFLFYFLCRRSCSMVRIYTSGDRLFGPGAEKENLSEPLILSFQLYVYLRVRCNQKCGTGSTWIRINLALLASDPDPAWGTKVFPLTAPCFSVSGDLPLESGSVKATRCRASYHGSEQRSLQPGNHCAPALQPSSSGGVATK